MANDLFALVAFAELHSEFIKNAYIRKLPNGKYRVYSEKGKNLGTYNTREQAKKRLRQIEFFKHKKAATNIDMSNLDGVSYSAIIRELRKQGNDEAANEFISMYKKCFDACVVDGIENPAECALPTVIMHMKKMYGFKLPEK